MGRLHMFFWYFLIESPQWLGGKSTLRVRYINGEQQDEIYYLQSQVVFFAFVMLDDASFMHVIWIHVCQISNHVWHEFSISPKNREHIIATAKMGYYNLTRLQLHSCQARFNLQNCEKSNGIMFKVYWVYYLPIQHLLFLCSPNPPVVHHLHSL